MLTVSTTNFKAEPRQSQSIFYNNSSGNRAASIPYENDSLDLQAYNLEKQMQKQQRNKEKWQKWSVIGTCSIGAAILA